MKTLLLDNTYWDLLLDSGGNIAVAAEPYAFAQDVASALKLFAAELWYDYEDGIPYFTEILGQSPPLGVFQELMVNAAKTVPGVVSAECTINALEDRTVRGSVAFTDINGQTGTVNLS